MVPGEVLISGDPFLSQLHECTQMWGPRCCPPAQHSLSLLGAGKRATYIQVPSKNAEMCQSVLRQIVSECACSLLLNRSLCENLYSVFG